MSLLHYIYSWLSRCCTARGSSTRFSQVGPTRFKTHKSFLLTEKFPCIENKEHLLGYLSHLFYHLAQILYTVAKCYNQLFGFSEVCDLNGDMVSDKSCHICSIGLLTKYEKYGTLSFYNKVGIQIPNILKVGF